MISFLTMNSLCRVARIASTTTTGRAPPSPPLIHLLLRCSSSSSSSGDSSSKKRVSTKLWKESPPSSSGSEEWARPREIPFQAKVANSIHFIGSVITPIQSHALPNGNFSAATVIAHQPSLRIPVIFEGDLAHIAISHLKEGDLVYIGGQLCAEPSACNVVEGQARIQVMVKSINFVKGSSEMMKSYAQMTQSLHEQREEEDTLKNPTYVEDNKDVSRSWKGPLATPRELWEISEVDNEKGVKNEIKNGGELLQTGESTHKLIQQKLEVVKFDEKTEVKEKETSMPKGDNPGLSTWRDLVDNPKQWWDHRGNKLSGLVNPRYPDFKRKDGGVALWLDRAPGWIKSKLEALEFDVQIQKSKQMKQGQGDESWKDLAENPDKWWDNRLDKKNVRGPDFKHKETGLGLWLNSAPIWVLAKLPVLKGQPNISSGKSGTLLS